MITTCRSHSAGGAPPARARWASPRYAAALLYAVLTATIGLLACSDEPEEETILSDITLTEVRPGQLAPGTRLQLRGVSFLPEVVGATTLVITGSFAGAEVQVALGAQFIDYDQMVADWPGGVAAGLPAEDGLLTGTAHVELRSAFDGLLHQSPPLPVTLEIHTQLPPRLDAAQSDGDFINDPILLYGDSFLLGGAEGETIAVVEGCFVREGDSVCAPVGPTEIRTTPIDPYDRTQLSAPFSPYIAGIQPGHFEGTVRVENRHGPQAGAAVLGSDAYGLGKEIGEPMIAAFTPSSASLGQYVDITGGGFVGVPTDQPSGGVTELTIIELDGTFTLVGQTTSTPVSLSLVPEFFHGKLVRYVVNEEDVLGHSLDLWSQAGHFQGTARPVVEFGSDSVMGGSTPVQLGIDYVKQVIWLRFLPTYVESLRHFGLRAADQRLRERILEVVRRDYTAINLEWREQEPTDFALYSVVDIAGTDPNQLGLMGYDNTPGKDTGNRRLYDQIGGVNAQTQEDGFPGYGGVFVESLFLFSLHPGPFAESSTGSDLVFDLIFDPFRPDIGGAPIGTLEVDSVPRLTDSLACPASDRTTQMACAIWALGSMIGTITSHEVGHSLGLADPGGPEYHNTGDWPNAIMDSGYARTFRERAELLGEGPGIFCRHNWDYLHQVLPTDEPDPIPDRLTCY